MCISLPGEIVAFDPDRPDLAEVVVEGHRHTINVGMLVGEDLAPGDWVLIQAGCALARIDAEEAKAALDFVKALNQSFEDEIGMLVTAKVEEPPW